MLAADKLQLQSQLKRQATELKEKEFALHYGNVNTVGTQAAVLAGLNVTMFIELHVEEEITPFALRIGYFTSVVLAFTANLLVVAHCTMLSVLGTGLALRGPDGSMIRATEVLFKAKEKAYRNFGVGLIATLIATSLAVWILLPPPSAFCCMLIAFSTIRAVFKSFSELSVAFHYSESEAVDLSDILTTEVARVGSWLPKSTRGSGAKKDGATPWGEVIGALVGKDPQLIPEVEHAELESGPRE
jgi:hypothetical protein